jgi:hypothetical protein
VTTAVRSGRILSIEVIRLKTACRHGTKVGTHEVHARRIENPWNQDGIGGDQ